MVSSESPFKQRAEFSMPPTYDQQLAIMSGENFDDGFESDWHLSAEEYDVFVHDVDFSGTIEHAFGVYKLFLLICYKCGEYSEFNEIVSKEFKRETDAVDFIKSCICESEVYKNNWVSFWIQGLRIISKEVIVG